MKRKLSSLFVSCAIFSVSAENVNLDKFGRTLDQAYPNTFELNKQQPISEKNSTFLLTDKGQSTNFVVGTAYKPGQTQIRSVDFGDVDGDGDQELIAVSSFYFDENNDYSVFIFHPTESDLGTPTVVKYNATANRNGLTIADLDSDGSDEIIIGHGQGLTIIKSNTIGGYDTQNIDSVTADTLDSIDIDLDGNMDVVGLPWSAPANQYYGDGLGNISFIESLNTNASGYNDQAIGDLNNDGFDDLVVMSGQLYATPNFSIHLHDGVDSLGAADSHFVGVNENTSGLGVGDINGDGRDDIVLARGRNSPTHLWLYTQNSDGTLEGPSQLPTHDIPETIRVADINADGFDDILVLHGGWTTLGIYLNGPSGYGSEIRVSIPYASHYDPEGLALGDLNNDGCPEMIAIADYNSGVVPVTHDLCPEVQTITENFSDTVRRVKIIPFTTSAIGNIDLSMEFDASINLDMKLYDASKNELYRAVTTGSPEVITTEDLDAGTYYLKIFNRDKINTTFDLQITHY